MQRSVWRSEVEGKGRSKRAVRKIRRKGPREQTYQRRLHSLVDGRKKLREMYREIERALTLRNEKGYTKLHLPPGLKDKGNQSLFYAHTSASAMTQDKYNRKYMGY